MLAAFLVLFAFYLGGAVASALFTYWSVKVFGMAGMLPGGRGVAFVVVKIALCWPVDAPKFAFPRMPKAEAEVGA